MKVCYSLLALAFVLSCGGPQSAGPDTLGESEATSSDDDTTDTTDSAGGDDTGDTSEAKKPDSTESDSADNAGPGDQPLVTFKLNNLHKEELVFSMDKGWQPVLFAFTGQRPNAKGVILFPKHCTSPCDASAEEMCPYCPEPEKVKDIRAAEKRDVVAPNSSISVPWDGQVYEYEKTKGTRNGKPVKCECYRTKPAPADSYTLRSCGLRITKSASRSSKYQCPEKSITLPPDSPTVIELDFPKP